MDWNQSESRYFMPCQNIHFGRLIAELRSFQHLLLSAETVARHHPINLGSGDAEFFSHGFRRDFGPVLGRIYKNIDLLSNDFLVRRRLLWVIMEPGLPSSFEWVRAPGFRSSDGGETGWIIAPIPWPRPWRWATTTNSAKPSTKRRIRIRWILSWTSLSLNGTWLFLRILDLKIFQTSFFKQTV